LAPRLNKRMDCHLEEQAASFAPRARCGGERLRENGGPGVLTPDRHSEANRRIYCWEAGLLVPLMKACISSNVTVPSLSASIALKMRS
jgi:hypothetical protein